MSNVIVVGCGRVGSQLANMLSDNGNNVCVIDKNVNAFANLGRNFNGSTVQGVGFDEETLVKAGVEDCDVMAAVTQFDNTNLMCAEVGSRLFGVPHVIARLYNPDHERAYMQLGIDYVCGRAGARSRRPHHRVRAQRRLGQLYSYARLHPLQRGFGARLRAP